MQCKGNIFKFGVECSDAIKDFVFENNAKDKYMEPEDENIKDLEPRTRTRTRTWN